MRGTVDGVGGSDGVEGHHQVRIMLTGLLDYVAKGVPCAGKAYVHC